MIPLHTGNQNTGSERPWHGFSTGLSASKLPLVPASDYLELLRFPPHRPVSLNFRYLDE